MFLNNFRYNNTKPAKYVKELLLASQNLKQNENTTFGSIFIAALFMQMVEKLCILFGAKFAISHPVLKIMS